MASSFPILFGAPSFGDEDRDQWIRVLQLFLADPFAPHAVNVGGETQVQYGWSVPAGAVSGSTPSNPIPPNAFGIPQMIVQNSMTAFPDGAIIALADRPGFMFMFIPYAYNDNISVTLWLGPDRDLQWSGDTSISGVDLFWSVKDDPGKFNVYQESNVYYIQNTTGSDYALSAMHIAMGPVFGSYTGG